MGDNLKLSRDKRHRSSSSIAGSNVKNTCSERKVNIRVSIPEVDDQFALAEARCDELKEKLDFVKSLKRKRKLKKRSVTRVAESLDAAPFISVQTQPKKRLQAGPRLRCGDMSPTQSPVLPPVYAPMHPSAPMLHGQTMDFRRTHAPPPYDNCTQEEILQYDVPNVRTRKNNFPGQTIVEAEKPKTVCEEGDGTRRSAANMLSPRRLNVRGKQTKPVHNKSYEGQQVKPPVATLNRRRNITRDGGNTEGHGPPEDRSVVELFYKNRSATSNDLRSESKNCVTDRATYGVGENEASSTKEQENQPRRLKYRSRRYELPTVASQMKQAGVRFYNNDYGSIPFIISKSTAPSHNIAVNLQQVLNGFKNQQPLKGIPLTMAYHMGLGHLPDYVTGNVQPLLENRGMNAIRLGRRLLRLPDKLVSYNRLLSLYREGDGVVSRFLRAINRPHRFYTSMYNLATREEPGAGMSATKVWGRSEEAKRSLAVYASLYREFQLLERNLKENPNNPELVERKQELTRQLADREEYIRQHVLQDHPEYVPTSGIRATASTADDSRFSNHKINLSTKVQ